MTKETVEEFLARGGKIQEIPSGQGAYQIRAKHTTKGTFYTTEQVKDKNFTINPEKGLTRK